MVTSQKHRLKNAMQWIKIICLGAVVNSCMEKEQHTAPVTNNNQVASSKRVYTQKPDYALTDITDTELCAFIRKHPNVKHLNLISSKLTDASITIVAQYCQQLTTLNLSGCYTH